nr:MFS transporter [Actinoplanes maris]
MLLKPYRDTLALPGIRSLLAVATLARIPIAAGAVVLTLHVVMDLGRGYGAAGLIGAAFTIGGSVGAPLMGRLVDRRGLRLVLVLTTVAEVLFWSLAPAAPYWALLVMALFGGLLSLPAFSVARQSISALTPEAQRLPAFALDSISTEIAFMSGPALGVLVATTAGPRWAMLGIGAGILISGVGLWLLDPPVRAAHEAPITAGERVPRRSWLKPRFVAILLVTMAATLVLSGTDVSVVAVLRDNGELGWTGLVMTLWAFYSLVGGFAYGTIQRALPPVLLLTPMAVATMLVSAGSSHWWLLALLLIPAGALCAPLITSTADAISRMIPAAARGEALGLHNSALTVGVALGGPLAGFAADTFSPPWGFVTVGGAGLLIALVVLPTVLRRPHTKLASTPTSPAKTAADMAASDMAASHMAARATTAPTAATTAPPTSAAATAAPATSAATAPAPATSAATAPAPATSAATAPAPATSAATAPATTASATVTPATAAPATIKAAPATAASRTTAPDIAVISNELSGDRPAMSASDVPVAAEPAAGEPAIPASAVAAAAASEITTVAEAEATRAQRPSSQFRPATSGPDPTAQGDALPAGRP